MSQDGIFLNPKLTGRRFEDHTLPVEFMSDFAALEELLIELAKHKYLEAHTDRKRVPRGFSDGVSLKISSIGEGSVVTNLVLSSALAANTLFSNGENTLTYFEQAKEQLLQSISHADLNEPINLPSRFIAYFNRIGKNLGDDEAIIFSPSTPERQAKLNKQSRRKILLSVNENAEFLDNGVWVGVISELDKQQQTFTFRNHDLQISGIAISEEHKETIYNSFSLFEEGMHVKVKGIAKFNASNKISMITTIEHIDLLDANDIEVRLNYISSLKSGWYYGEGTVFDKQRLYDFLKLFNSNCDPNVPNPATYPTVDGKIQLEWSSDTYDDSLTVDLSNFSATFHSLKFADEKEFTLELDLTKAEDWDKLNDWFKGK
ncbi:MAG: hypothetical protein RL264_489 [Bacteroidota bacterium]|jgi:hypothetical protein